MKNLISRLIIASVIVTTISACGTSSYMIGDEDDYYYQQQQPRQVSYNMFYDQLSPYGNWINYPGYGQVWVVNEPGFMPYQTNGRWLYTNMGWTWASNYNWGWATFHYGRWAMDPRHGWFWVPGYDWAPAWVDWRSNNSYYGWAPMAPHNWRYRNSYDPWVFVSNQHMHRSNLHQYYVSRDQNPQLVQKTTVIRPPRSGSDFNPGPSRVEVERNTKEVIRPLQISNADRAERSEITSNELKVFRPRKEEITGIKVQQPERQTFEPLNERSPQQREIRTQPRMPHEATPQVLEPSQSERPNRERARTFEPQRPVERNIPQTEPIERMRERQPVREYRPQPQSRPVERTQQPVERMRERQYIPQQQPVQRTQPVQRAQPMQRAQPVQ